MDTTLEGVNLKGILSALLTDTDPVDFSHNVGGRQLFYRWRAPSAKTLTKDIRRVAGLVGNRPDSFRSRVAILLVHPGKYMSRTVERVLRDSSSWADIYFVGKRSSFQADYGGTPPWERPDLSRASRATAVQRLFQLYGSVAVFACEDDAVPVALDRLFGTQLYAAHLGQSGLLNEVRTDREVYSLVPGAGWTLEKNLGMYPSVIVLPEYRGLSVTAIGPGAFAGSEVRFVHLPSSVRSIGVRAFSNCSQLTSVTLAAGLLNIMAGAFESTALERLVLPQGLQTIGQRAFANCTQLESVSIPASVVSIDEEAFNGCDPLMEFVVVDGSFAHLWAYRKGLRVATVPPPLGRESLLTEGGIRYRVVGSSQVELASVTQSARNRAYLEVPDVVDDLPVVGLGQNALRGMSRLRKLRLPESIRWIGPRALAYSPQLSPNNIEIEGIREVLYIAPDAMPGHNLDELMPSEEKVDDRSARFTPRSLLTHMGATATSEALTRILDDELTRIVHIPSQVRPGAAFFYWYDENDFHEEPSPEKDVAEAMKRGAVLLVSREPVKLPNGSELPTLIHPSPRDFFREINTVLRGQYQPKTVTITGSIGKTTTKQMVELVVQDSFRSKVSEGNNNNVNFTGRVFSTLDRSHEVYVQETGASYFGQVEALNAIAQPDALVVTNIGTNHLTGYGESQQELLRDKLSPEKSLPDDGVVFLNWDDPLLREAPVSHEVISFSLDSPDARYQAVDITEASNLLSFLIVDHLTGDKTAIELNLVGRHNAYSALTAFAIGRWLGIDSEKIADSLSDFKPQFMRQALLDMENQHVLVDCYNASEASVVGSAQSLRQMHVNEGGKRVFVFGDLTNRGSQSEALHRQIGEDLASQTPIDLLVCYGQDSRVTAEVAASQGTESFHTESLDELVEYLKAHTGPGDAVAFKASRRMRLEQAVDALYGTTLALGRSGLRVVDKLPPITAGNLELKPLPGRGLGISGMTDSEQTNLVTPSQVDGRPVDVLLPDALMGTSLVTVSLSEPVRTIGANALRQCRSLKSIELPKSLRVIDSAAFSACSSLEVLVIPDGVRHIGKRAFRFCRKLKMLHLPASVSYLGEELLLGSPNVTVSCPEGSYSHEFMMEHWPDVPLELSTESDL